MVLSFGIIGQDSPSRSAMSRRPAFRQQAPSSRRVLRTFSTIVRMILTMVPKNSAIFTAHGAMMRPCATLWQCVLVMWRFLLGEGECEFLSARRPPRLFLFHRRNNLEGQTA